MKDVLNILLAPFSALYGVVLLLRHILYDEHILPSHTPSTTTICVGNLAVGGTGKTPHVEYLVQLLSPHFRVAVLSRGYGRRTKGFMLADEHSSATTIGDEPMQIHTHFPTIPMAVCSNRIIGCKLLKKHFPDLDVIILDDAFQHRRIRCNLNILLTTYDNPFYQDHLLPWGKLRDLKLRGTKAEIIIITKCPPTLQPIDKRVTKNHLPLAAFQEVYFSCEHQEPLPTEGTTLVITGIANPKHMFEYIRQQQPKAKCIQYPDHHRFTKRNILLITEQAKQYDYVLTTEKDFMRLQDTHLPDELKNKMYTLKEQVDFRDEKTLFDKKILTAISESIYKHKKRK